MGKRNEGAPRSPSERSGHGSGDRNESAYVTPGKDPKEKGVDERYGPDYSESEGGSVRRPPPKPGPGR